MEYEARLEALRLWSLEERRNRADLIEVFKMMHGLSFAPVTAFFQVAANSCTPGHSRKLVKAHCRTQRGYKKTRGSAASLLGCSK